MKFLFSTDKLFKRNSLFEIFSLVVLHKVFFYRKLKMSISRSLNFSIFQSSIKDDIEELEDEIDEDYDDDYDWGKKIFQKSYPTVRD